MHLQVLDPNKSITFNRFAVSRVQLQEEKLPNAYFSCILLYSPIWIGHLVLSKHVYGISMMMVIFLEAFGDIGYDI